MRGIPFQIVGRALVRKGRCLASSAFGILSTVLLAACSDDRGPAASARATNLVASIKIPGTGVKRPAASAVRFVKLEQLTEWTGKPWASMAELNLIDSTGAAVDRTSWTVTADSADDNDAPANAVDGDSATLWHTRWNAAAPPPPPHAILVNLGASIKVSGFRYLPRQDAISNGIIARYRFYASSDGVNWGEPVAEGDFSGMGAATVEKTVVFAEQTTNHPPVLIAPVQLRSPFGQSVSVQLTASDADSDRLAYECRGLPTGLGMSAKTGLITGTPIVPGAYKVAVSVNDSKGLSATVDFPWTVEPPLSAGNAPRVAPGEARFVKLEQLSETNGNPWGSVAELNVVDVSGANLPRVGWTASADSADASDRPGNAIDGNPASIWHSRWDGASPPPPHSLIIDMGQSVQVRGFRYMPRQDRVTNGMIGKFRFYLSADGVNWGQPATEGDFSTMGSPVAEKTVVLQ